ncbi:MAG: sigma-70 family RNA polymerase sigma factor [Acidobacteriota bacterium]
MNEQSLEHIVEAMYPHIFLMVRLALRLHNHPASEGEIEDLSHEAVLLLIEDDFRRLRTFDETKASIKTWLKAVVMHHVGRHIQQQAAHRLDQISESNLLYAHENETFAPEHKRAEIRDALNKLTERERQLFDLLCKDEMNVREIAAHMGIQVDSVYRRKHALIQKLRSFLNGGGIGKFRGLV